MTAPASPARTAVEYEAVIGIEIHVQLRTASKMFCSCATDIAEAPPNSRTCPICLGLPGTLPVINRAAVRHVLATGIALGGSIPAVTRWDRKNYFYPDLPKGYQISQFDLPLASGGALTVDTSAGPVTVAIRRAHLEEDTARLVHHVESEGRRVSLIDFNRSGMPLMEVVTEPVIPTAEAARRYAEELRLLLLAIGASDAALENGQMRVEANVSIRPVGEAAFGTRVEVKNMNSFRSVERAIGHELERQVAAIAAGEMVVQETRGWDDGRGATYVMRVKEDSDDYRYFPEPDLPPLRTDEAWLETIRAALPELPAMRRERYRMALGLSPYDAAVLVADAGATELFEETLAVSPGLAPKRVANWVAGEYMRLAGRESVAVRPTDLAALLRAVEERQISGTSAKEVFARHAQTGDAVSDIIRASGMRQISDEAELREVIARALQQNPAAVADVRAGKGQAAGFLVGRVMKLTRGQADASLVQRLVREALASGESG